MLPCGVTKPAARLLPKATPSTGAIVERHGTGERGDFAIVDHVEGDAVPSFRRSKKRRRIPVSKACCGTAR
jgi:hypothetical protein